MTARAWLMSLIGSLLGFAAVAACSASGGDTNAIGPGPAGGNGGSPNDSAVVFDGTGGFTLSDANCGAATYGATRIPASVLVLLDRSGSMSLCPNGEDSGCATIKWDGARTAIDGALSSAPPELRFGLSFFPAGNYPYYLQCNTCEMNAMQGIISPECTPVLQDCGCHDVLDQPVVPIDALSTTLPLIQSQLDQIGPDGNTPTYHALESAYAFMSGIADEGDRYVLLMTDGDPTIHQAEQAMPPPFTGKIPESFLECKELSDILGIVESAAKATPSVRTFVIGSPGVTNDEFMSNLALAGNTPKGAGCEASNACYYQIGTGNFSADLQGVLTSIAGQIATCTFAVPPGTADVDPTMVNVTYNAAGTDAWLLQDSARKDGWDYVDDTHSKIEIFGTACDQIKANTESSVSILLGCQTLVK